VWLHSQAAFAHAGCVETLLAALTDSHAPLRPLAAYALAMLAQRNPLVGALVARRTDGARTLVGMYVRALAEERPDPR
jgi:hypothetical protein